MARRRLAEQMRNPTELELFLGRSSSTTSSSPPNRRLPPPPDRGRPPLLEAERRGRIEWGQRQRSAPGVGDGAWAGSSAAAAAGARECGCGRPAARLELIRGASARWIEEQGVRAGEERGQRPSPLELEQRKEGSEGGGLRLGETSVAADRGLVRLPHRDGKEEASGVGGGKRENGEEKEGVGLIKR
jgi:hypothetical protein